MDLADAGNHARHAFERVLVRDIAALVERPVHVRVEVGVADGHVQQLHAELPMQAASQRERLGQIRLRTALRRNAPAIGVREAVVDIQARGDEKTAAGGGLRGAHAVYKQASAVFQAAAERARPRISGQQLAVQVPVAALDIHAVKAGGLREGGRLAELLLEREQVVVGQDAVGCNGAIAFENRVVVGDQGRGHALGLGIAARMGGL